MRAALCGSQPVGPNPMTEQNEQAPPLALRPREAAQRLRISERLLWQLTHDGHIPCVRVGTGKRKSILYPVSLLEEWLRDQAAEGGAQ
jgi:excisionase family DNA binding protein